MSETEVAAVAITYAHAGWKVFPLWWVHDGRCGCPDGPSCTSPGKHPLVRQGVKDASDDVERIGAWWDRWPSANIGMPAGDNGLAVLDIDPRHGGHESLSRLVENLLRKGYRLPQTLTQSTGGGGLHLVFSAPEGGIKGGSNVFGPSMTGLDTRGRGGYIVAAPSVHASGREYRWVDLFADPAPWPQILSEWMEPEVVKPAKAYSNPYALALLSTVDGGAPARRDPLDLMSTVGGYAEMALRGELARVRAACEGERNHTLNRAAFALGQLVAANLLDHDRVVRDLTDAGQEIGLGDSEIRATLRSGLLGGARAPRDLAGIA